MKTTKVCAFLAIFGLTASVAHASDPVASATMTVEKVLTEPLAQQELKRARFSRAAIAPRTRTVRVLDQRPRRDPRGAEFFAFSIDEQRGLRAVVRKDAFRGCIYPNSGQVFIARGDAHYPAGLLLGKTSKKAEAHVCVESKVQVARVE